MVYFRFNLAKYGPICEKTYPQKLVAGGTPPPSSDIVTTLALFLILRLPWLTDWLTALRVQISVSWPISVKSWVHLLPYLCSVSAYLKIGSGPAHNEGRGRWPFTQHLPPSYKWICEHAAMSLVMHWSPQSNWSNSIFLTNSKIMNLNAYYFVLFCALRNCILKAFSSYW